MLCEGRVEEMVVYCSRPLAKELADPLSEAQIESGRDDSALELHGKVVTGQLEEKQVLHLDGQLEHQNTASASRGAA
jgi:hypothetical protein